MYITPIISNFSEENISQTRKEVLLPFINFIKEKQAKSETINLNFICTHNSRRSHLSQIWAQSMAHYFGVHNVYCYSAGTEATAIFSQVIETLQTQGFGITALSQAPNPVIAVKFDTDAAPVVAFSKSLEHNFNPGSNFAAIMTCDHADKNCPIMPGALARIPVNYTDPKASDGTPQMAQKYLEKSLEIAQEMWWVFKNCMV